MTARSAHASAAFPNPFERAALSCQCWCGDLRLHWGGSATQQEGDKKGRAGGGEGGLKKISALETNLEGWGWGVQQQLKWAKTIKGSAVIDCRFNIPGASNLGPKEGLPKPIFQNQMHAQDVQRRSIQSYSRL